MGHQFNRSSTEASRPAEGSGGSTGARPRPWTTGRLGRLRRPRGPARRRGWRACSAWAAGATRAADRGSAAATSAPPSSTCCAPPPRAASSSTATRSSSRSPSAAATPGGPAPARSTRPSSCSRTRACVATDDERGRRVPAAHRRGRDATSPSTPTSSPRCGAVRPDRQQGRRVRRPQARDRAGHGRGVADRHPGLGEPAPGRGRRPRRHPPPPLRHPRRRRRRRGEGRRTSRTRRRERRLRIGDAEREQAAADLGEHFAQGRLSADEHAERLDQVCAPRPGPS